jgi:hypothetical protein
VTSTEPKETFVTIEELLSEVPEDRLDRACARIARMDVEELKLALSIALFEARSAHYPAVGTASRASEIARRKSWLINRDFTRRGIPPCFRFRRPPDASEFGLNGRYDLALWDADWITTRHPNHKVLFGQHKALFTPKTFLASLGFLFYFGNRPPWNMCRALGLTEAQQWECQLLQSGAIGKRRRQISKMRPKMELQIATAQDHKRQRGRSAADKAKTLERLKALWLCGSMSDWKAQRTADLYHMLTGDRIARNLAAKQIEKIKAIQYLARARSRSRAI